MSLIRQNKIQDGVNDSLLMEVNSSLQAEVHDTDTLAKLVELLAKNTEILADTTAILAKNTEIEANQTDKTQMTQITDGTDEVVVNTNGSINVETDTARGAFGEQLSANLYPQYQGTFEYTVGNTELNTNTEVNGGTVTQGSGMCVVSTSTTTASTAEFKSKRHARYRAGLGGLQRFTALFTTPVAATEQLVGLADETGSSEAYKNGYMIGYIGTVFGYHRYQNDVLTTVPIAQWDDPLDGTGASGTTIDQTKLGVWAIQFQYLGAGAVKICFENPATGNLDVVHVDQYANANIVPSTFNPNFHFTIWTDNKATTTDLILKSASYAYFIEGMTSNIELHQPQFNTDELSKSTVTTEVAIFTIRNKSTYQSKTNYVDLMLENFTGSIEAASANNLGDVRLVKDATLGGSPSYADINTSDSVVDIDVAGTTVTGGKTLITIPLAGKNDRAFENLVDYKILIGPGETVTLAGTSGNSATINGALLWKELV